jgi:prepilin-type N-terminal cleavage/methylation domain-containing protein
MKHLRRGFTLIELLVVIAIVAILAGVVYVNFNEARQQSRDIQRQADLRALQDAVERYKARYGYYPAGCNGVGNWSGEPGGPHQCPGGNPLYIVGLVPEFMNRLPQDPRRGAGAGYVYVSNRNNNVLPPSGGSVYKIMAINTVEQPLPNSLAAYEHAFKSCDVRLTAGGNLPTETDPIGSVRGLCHFVGHPTDGSGVPPRCAFDNAEFRHSYAVWGGLASLNFDGTGIPADRRNVIMLSRNPFSLPLTAPSPPNQLEFFTNQERTRALTNTTDIICRI